MKRSRRRHSHRHCAWPPVISSAPTRPSSPARRQNSRAIEMSARADLDWPFFDERHRQLAAELSAWAETELTHLHHGHSIEAVDDACRQLVLKLGRGGWLRYAVA